MKKHYSTDTECLLTGGLWALIVALIIGGFWLFFVDVWPAVFLGVAMFVVGLVIAVFMCKTRTVGRGIVTESAVALARAEMGMAQPPEIAGLEDEPEPEPTPEPEPEPEAAPVHEDHAEEVGEGEAKPELLTEARGGQADDLKKIKGVGPKLEKELNGAGVFHFDQIAGWSAQEVTWADQHLVSFKGRVSRDNWVAQAIELAKN